MAQIKLVRQDVSNITIGTDTSSSSCGIAIGGYTTADGGVAIGYCSKDLGWGVAVGSTACSSGAGVAIGMGSCANGQSVAIGCGAKACANSIAIGPCAVACHGHVAFSVGGDSFSTSFYTFKNAILSGGGSSLVGQTDDYGGRTRLGYCSTSNGCWATAVGRGANACWYGTTVGYGACACDKAVAIGAETTADQSSTAIGRGVRAYHHSIAIGAGATACGGQIAFSIGTDSFQTDFSTFKSAILSGGGGSTLSGETTSSYTTLGIRASTNGSGCSVAIGTSASSKTNGVAIGDTACANENGVAIGCYSFTSGTNSVAIGICANAQVENEVAIGAYAGVTLNAVAVGAYAQAYDRSVAIGCGALAWPNSLAIGAGANACEGKVAFSIGTDSFQTDFSTFKSAILSGGSGSGNIVMESAGDANTIEEIVLSGSTTVIKPRTICGTNGITVTASTNAIFICGIDGETDTYDGKTRLGYCSSASGCFSTAVGNGASAGYGGLALGCGAKAAWYGIAIGTDACAGANQVSFATDNDSFTVDFSTFKSAITGGGCGGGSSLVGCTDDSNTALGVCSGTCGGCTVAVGKGAYAADSATAMGYMACAKESSVAIGKEAQIYGTNSVAIGICANTQVEMEVAVGAYASATLNAVAIGNGSYAQSYGVAIGCGAMTYDPNSIAIGAGAIACGEKQVAFANGEENVVISWDNFKQMLINAGGSIQ